MTDQSADFHTKNGMNRTVQQKLIEQHEYDPRDDFPEPGLAYALRNPRCSQLIPMCTEKLEILLNAVFL